MTPKPKIQYVGQFYVHGSEAPAIQHQQRKKTKTKLPAEHKARVLKIYVDPVAVISLVVSLSFLVAMALGVLRMRSDWVEYQQMKSYVTQLKQDNEILRYRYHNCFDLEEVRTKAIGLGMVPSDTVKTMTVQVTHPEPEPQRTWLDDLKWFVDGLLE